MKDGQNQLPYVTAADLEATARQVHLSRHPDNDDPQLRRANEEYFASPEFAAWVAARVEEARKLKRLVTPQQQRDLRAGRFLQPGDKVKYIGPEVIETVLPEGETTPRYVTRPHGQLGRIAEVTNGVLRFCPELPRATFEAATRGDLHVDVVQLETRDWRLFERRVGSP